METQFFELVRVYHFLASEASIKVELKFLFEELPLNVSKRMFDYCNAHNIPYDVCDVKDSFKKISKIQFIKTAMCKYVGGSSPFIKHLFYETNFFRDYFLSEKIKLMFIGEDGVGTSPSIFCAAKKLKIPTIVVPYEYSQKQQAIESIISNSSRPPKDFQPENWKQRIIFFLFRKWTTTYQSEIYLRLPRAISLAMLFFNSGPKLPWSVNGGDCSKLFCDSPHMRDFYYKEGIDKKKIRLTGNLGYDEMHLFLKENERYWLAYSGSTLIDNKKIRVLFAFPPDYTSRQKSIFKKYEDFIDYWVKLSQISNLIEPYFQVHPAVTEEQKNYIESKGITLETDNIVKLIPKIDVLITSVSSVIRLAIALKKPVINFDLYHFNYPDYLMVSGVRHIDNLDDFHTEFSKISSEMEYVRALKKDMSEESLRWGIIDGQVKNRMLAEIKEYL